MSHCPPDDRCNSMLQNVSPADEASPWDLNVQWTRAVDLDLLIELHFTFVKVGHWLTSPKFQSPCPRSRGLKKDSEAVRSFALMALNHIADSWTAVRLLF